MIQFWDCAKGTWVKVWSKAEVLRHGWAWHAGTAALAISINCDAPPAVAFGGPLPPLPVHEAPPPTQPAIPWYPPAYSALPPEMLLPPVPMQGLPIPWGDVGPGVVAQETAPVERHHKQDDCDDTPGTPVSAPEPSGVWVLLLPIAGLLMRRVR